jgi:hypothetical protein
MLEDAAGGVQADHAGRFGLMIGVDRSEQQGALANATPDLPDRAGTIACSDRTNPLRPTLPPT